MEDPFLFLKKRSHQDAINISVASDFQVVLWNIFISFNISK